VSLKKTAEGLGEFVVACCDATGVLETIEAARDALA
jgi:hypothetical protein